LHRQSAKVTQVAGSSRRLRDPEPDVPPLFRSDRQENFSLWMQNCFPDPSLVREPPIRQWLASPLEARLQRNHNHRADSAKLHGSEMPGAVRSEATDDARSNKSGAGNPKRLWRWNSQTTDGIREDPFLNRFAYRVRNNSTLPLKFAKYLVLALLLIAVFWSTPTRKEASLANASIAAAQTSKPETGAAANVPLPQRQEVETASGFATEPITIENISVVCENTQPCIKISTRGNGALPKLSTLSDPERVVMDFEHTVLSFKVHRITVGRGGVRAVRMAENGAQPPRTRVVIDLMEKCDYKLQTLTNGVVVTVYCKGTSHQAGDNTGTFSDMSDVAALFTP
jgi:hypothetical protein